MLARNTRWMVALAIALLVPAARPAGAQSPTGPPAGYKEGIHIVRPGDTLEQLAAIFLGSARRWPEIARLNPDVKDPKRLPPGKRLRIYVAERGAGNSAQIAGISKKVEERPVPIGWSEASKGDLLVEQDGVRTYAKASAEIGFNDGTQLFLTEDSLVFLRRSGEHLKGVARRSVEIVQGQAEVNAGAAGTEAAPGARTAKAAPATPEIEIVLGATKATSRPNAEGVAKARARKPGEGGAKVMVYGGQGEVEAAGAKVALAEGTGTSVGKEGPPSPPEKLLHAPLAINPPPNIELAFNNPFFNWQAVPEAAGYVVELCSDPACAILLDRRILGAETEWRPEGIPVGTLYWRVTARSRSGLDGYPSRTNYLKITADQADHEPPVAHLEIAGPVVRVGERLFTAGGLSFEVVAEDKGCGLFMATPSILGLPPDATTWPAGDYKAAGEALDRCGNRQVVAPIPFTVDTEAPTVRFEVTDRSIFAREGEPKEAHSSSGRSDAPGDAALSWSSDGRRWLYLWRPAEGSKAAVFGNDEIVSAQPQLFLRARGARLSIDGKTVETSGNQLLWIRVADSGAGVERLRFRAVEGNGAGNKGSAPTLELEAVDLVGNSRKLSWPLVLK
ncbi:MAG TPA: LysM peptidoglycan-binding domain-containing protein [Thermoanaerobaculia bacterium]|nr:LysM peptidoglycan-binding domain-containing protein [Thermoanaerobaculia bacterium]